MKEIKKEIKPVNWTLENLVRVKEITADITRIDHLKGVQIAIFPGADKPVGASAIDGSTTYTSNNFPIIGECGIIKEIIKKKGKASFVYTNCNGKLRRYTPKTSDIVFFMNGNKDDLQKKRLNPTNFWRQQ
jgi:hypothetical protein